MTIKAFEINLEKVADTRTAVGPEASGAVSRHSVGKRCRTNTEMNHTLTGRKGAHLNDKVTIRKWTFPICLYSQTVDVPAKSIDMLQFNRRTTLPISSKHLCNSEQWVQTNM